MSLLRRAFSRTFVLKDIVLAFRRLQGDELAPPHLKRICFKLSGIACGGLARSSVSRAILADKAEHVARHVAHLDLFGAFRDAIAAVMAIDVFELLMTRVAHAAMSLHRLIGRVTGKPVAAVIAHGDLV